MKSRKQLMATLVSSIISQVLVILVLLLSHSSIPPPCAFTNPDTHLPSSLLYHLFLLSLITTSFSPSHPSSPPSPSRKRRRFFLDDKSHMVYCSSSSSSSKPSPSIKYGDSHSNVSTPPTPKSFPLSISDSAAYKSCFRMSSETFEWLSGLLEPLLECRDPIGSSLNLSPQLRLGIGLFRLATGSSYADVSRRFCVSESTAKFCTKQLCRVLCTNFRFWVASSDHELPTVSATFQALGGLPNCCGALATTRFQTLSHHSVATQIVVDSTSRILNVFVSGFRGHKPDPVVLESSALYRDVQGGHLLSGAPLLCCSADADADAIPIPQYLIADVTESGSGSYPLLPWLMVPFACCPLPLSSQEENFNSVLRSMHRPALTALASLRSWGILSTGPIIEEDVNMAVACVGACSILHNVLLMRGDISLASSASTPLPGPHVCCSSSQPRSADNHSFCYNTTHTAASAIRDALAAQASQLQDRADIIQRSEQDRSIGNGS